MHKLAVVTGTRAEYGLLRPVLRRLAQSGAFETELLVTGTHLSAAHGATVAEIEADGFPIAARLDILSEEVPPGRVGTARRTAAALQGFLAWFEAHRPAALLALGDRYEMFAAGQAAALLNIPVAHISGGDVTFGADDDWFRHCLTKMAKLHFPSCEAYRQRLLRMGEEPKRVFNVGGLGDEIIRSTALLPCTQLAQQVHPGLAGPYALVTLHPETQSSIPPAHQAQVLLAALGGFEHLFLLFTGANADAGGEEINHAISAFCEGNPNAALVPSLGSLRYLSAMKHAAVVVGNSSSGVVEAPTLAVPAVDIGNRQTGRLAAENVLHCPMQEEPIRAAVQKALSPQFATAAAAVQSPYNGGDTSAKIVHHLQDALNSGVLTEPKMFYDGADCAE